MKYNQLDLKKNKFKVTHVLREMSYVYNQARIKKCDK